MYIHTAYRSLHGRISFGNQIRKLLKVVMDAVGCSFFLAFICEDNNSDLVLKQT